MQSRNKSQIGICEEKKKTIETRKSNVGSIIKVLKYQHENKAMRKTEEKIHMKK